MAKRKRHTTAIQPGSNKYKNRTIEYRAGYAIVRLNERVEDEERVLSEAMQGHPFEIVDRHPAGLLYLRLLNTDGETDLKLKIPLLAEAISRAPGFEWAEPDLILRGATVPNDPMLDPTHGKRQWGLEAINLYDAWDIQTGDDSVVICLLDSGVPLKDEPVSGIPLYQNLDGYMDHADFDGKRFIAGGNFVPESDGTVGTSMNDTDGHGTNMAGILAAKQNNEEGLAGVNWGAEIYVTRILDPNNTTTIWYMLQGARSALEYAHDNNKKPVFNLCLRSDVSDLSALAEFTHSIFPFFEAVVEADAVVCIAAGNSYSLGDPVPYIEYPAMLASLTHGFTDHIVVIGAITESLEIWEKSGRGLNYMVYAPGFEVGTTDISWGMEYYAKESGTSIAASHVSGLAALLWSQAPDRTAAEIVCCLKHTAKEPHPGAGYRIVDAGAALKAI